MKDKNKTKEQLINELDEMRKRVTEGVTRKNEDQQTEITLPKNEDRYRSVVENLGDMVYIVDTNGIATYLSPIAESLLGYSPSEIIGQSFADFIHQEDLPRSLEGFQNALSGQATVGEYRLLNKAGEIRWVRSSNRPMFEGNDVIGVTGVLSDITDRKNAEERLKKSEKALRLKEQFFRALMENASDGFMVLNTDGTISYTSNSYPTVLGYNSTERIGTDMLEKIHPDDTALVSRIFTDVLEETGSSARTEVRAQHKDGSWRFIEATGRNLLHDPAVKGITVALRDITDRRQAHEAVRKSEEKYRTLVENSHDAIIIVDMQGNVQFANKASEELTGYTLSEGIGMHITEFIAPNYYAEALTKLEEAKSGKPIPYFESAVSRKDGTVIPIETGGQAIIEGGETVGIQIITRDITTRKQAEERLKESETKYSAVVENSRDGIVVLQDGLVQFVNKISFELAGYTPEELIGVDFLQVVSPEEREVVAQRYLDRITGKQVPNIYETVLVTKDGVELPVELNATAIDYEGRPADLVFVRDIRERKQAYEALSESEQKFRATADQSPNMIFINRNGRVVYANQKCEEVTGYKREEICSSTFDFLSLVAPEWIGTVKANFNRHLQGEEVPPYEYSILTKDGKRIDALLFTKLMIYEGETAILGTVVDITERKLAEEELRQSFNRLLRTSEGMIQAMAATIESRDPYTAGHQRRVAELAGAIARDLGLPENQVEGVHMAATVHDIGKIYVPAEILSKPGQLNNVEFDLIKMHPQAGYDILKNIDLPWPVAEIVLGHHERLDGSGYPLGLIGDDISLETRILGVADVVEAISSHRPYRPAIGTDKALTEVSRESGILYDPAVVDACLRLFTENGFRFSSEHSSGTLLGIRNQHLTTA